MGKFSIKSTTENAVDEVRRKTVHPCIRWETPIKQGIRISTGLEVVKNPYCWG